MHFLLLLKISKLNPFYPSLSSSLGLILDIQIIFKPPKFYIVMYKFKFTSLTFRHSVSMEMLLWTLKVPDSCVLQFLRIIFSNCSQDCLSWSFRIFSATILARRHWFTGNFPTFNNVSYCEYLELDRHLLSDKQIFYYDLNQHFNPFWMSIRTFQDKL